MSKKVSKYDGIIQEFVQEKIEDPNLSIMKYCEDSKVKYIPFFRSLKRDPKIMETILDQVPTEWVDPWFFSLTKAKI